MGQEGKWKLSVAHQMEGRTKTPRRMEIKAVLGISVEGVVDFISKVVSQSLISWKMLILEPLLQTGQLRETCKSDTQEI